MRLVGLVSNLGYGSQREVGTMISQGRLTLATTGAVLPADAQVEARDVALDGEALDPAAGLVIMLNKPCGFTCSTQDPGRIVYELLPPRFARRNPVLAPIGRLDRDTSGLLLLTDDGALLHRIISPRHQVPKTYEVTLARSLSGDEAGIFASGALKLRSEAEPLAPATLEVLGEHSARLILCEGRYHQARRMFAATGNHVEALHRSSIGGLSLGALEPGKWRILSAEEVGAVLAPTATGFPKGVLEDH